jgi:hypothetical protein
MHESRHEWFGHEFKSHFLHNMDVDTVRDGFLLEASDLPDLEYSLCCQQKISGVQIQKHLARHLEELVLFALPKDAWDDEDNNDDKDQYSDDEIASEAAGDELRPINSGEIERDVINVSMKDDGATTNPPDTIDRPQVSDDSGAFATDIWMYKESGEKLPIHARLKPGMTHNAVRHSYALMLGHPIKEYSGGPCIMPDGTKSRPIGQVTLPFDSATFQNVEIQFIVISNEFLFYVCLGRNGFTELVRRKSEHLYR